jgi:hypothetical protein
MYIDIHLLATQTQAWSVQLVYFIRLSIERGLP